MYAHTHSGQNDNEANRSKQRTNETAMTTSTAHLQGDMTYHKVKQRNPGAPRIPCHAVITASKVQVVVAAGAGDGDGDAVDLASERVVQGGTKE